MTRSACDGIGPVEALRRLCAPAPAELDLGQVRQGQGVRRLARQHAFEGDNGLVQLPGALELERFVQFVVARHLA
jgi:hypothetical protein